MAYLLYTPGSTAEKRPDNVAIVGASFTDIESERHTLVNQAMNAALRGEGSSDDSVAIHRADYQHLPTGIVSRLLDRNYYTTPIMESKFGLAMYAPEGEDSPGFELLSEEIDDDFQMLEEGVDARTFNHLIARRDITHDALQLEPVREGGKLTVREHKSFGYIAVGGGYQPVVTLLSPEHPVRQLIDQNKANPL